MIDDGLEVLVAFRSGVPAPDEETTQRIYRLATSPRPRWRVLLRARLTRRSRLALAVVLVGLVIVPAALAFGGKIVDLFEGTPAPPAVTTTFEGFNRLADLSIRKGFEGQAPHADVSKAHGVIEIQTADGPLDLWAAPNDQGGLCWFIDFANDRTGSNGQPGFGTCDTPSTRSASNITFEGPLWMLAHPSLYTVDGLVYVDAATVALTRADGSTATLPVVEGLFLGSFDSGANVTQVTAYDKTGAKVAQRALP
jgi:hypothetical protein